MQSPPLPPTHYIGMKEGIRYVLYSIQGWKLKYVEKKTIKGGDPRWLDLGFLMRNSAIIAQNLFCSWVTYLYKHLVHATTNN